jgi:3alpha(or 20beta)-hydroxysteroid dehydrogenase
MAAFFSLAGKAAFVTGAARGLGLAVAERLAAAGARVALCDLQDARPQAERLGGLYLRADVADDAQMRDAMQQAREALGPLDLVVNNAGVTVDRAGITEQTDANIERCWRVNTLGVVHGIKHGAPLLRDGGAIVNIASTEGTRGMLAHLAYVASKWPVIGITRTAALELAPRRIRVNAICPASMRTPLALEGGGATMLKLEETITPLGRICEPEEVAALVHFLASDDCPFLTGQAILVDGGQSAGWSAQLWDRLGG